MKLHGSLVNYSNTEYDGWSVNLIIIVPEHWMAHDPFNFAQFSCNQTVQSTGQLNSLFYRPTEHDAPSTFTMQMQIVRVPGTRSPGREE